MTKRMFVPLLLFLSAMLSALTGAISGVGVAEAQVHQRSAVATGINVVVARIASVRQSRSWLALAKQPELQTIAPSPVAVAWTLAAPAPLYLSRPRE